MIIDTTEQEVAFQHEVLCIHELQALVDLLNNGPAGHPPIKVAKVEYPLVTYVQSFSRKGMFYQLTLEAAGKLWSCTCPDYTHRGYDDFGVPNGHACKHIRKHIYSRN